MRPMTGFHRGALPVDGRRPAPRQRPVLSLPAARTVPFPSPHHGGLPALPIRLPFAAAAPPTRPALPGAALAFGLALAVTAGAPAAAGAAPSELPEAAGAVAAQEPPAPGVAAGSRHAGDADPRPPQAAPDSASLLADARRAQARFERVRRNHVPWAWGSWSGPCDETIGRFCIWHTTGSDWEPPPDAPQIVAARARLLEELGEIAEAIPGDAWVLGQRVKYLGEADRWGEAAELARDCAAERAWCDGLLGFVRHNQEAYVEAGTAFERALAAMPEARRDAWTDPSILLDRDGQRWLEGAAAGGAEEEERLRRRVWWLGDPLYLVPGNQRWTEHLARQVMIEIQREARNPHWLRWGDDLSEILLRFGWSVAWERIRPNPMGALSSLSVVGRERPHSLRFLPPGRALEEPGGIEESDWRLDDPRPRSKYAAPRLRTMEPLPHQVATFRQGDSLLVVASFELPRDVVPRVAANGAGPPVGDGDPPGGSRGNGSDGGGHPRQPPDGAVGREAGDDGFRSGFFLVPEGASIPGTEPMAAGPASGGPTGGEGASASAADAGDSRVGAFLARVPAGSYVLSLEVWDPEGARAWRERRELRPAPRAAGVPAIDDLLLHRVNGEPPASVEEAATLMLPATRLRRGEPVGVAWEIDDVPARTALSFRITVGDREAGRLRRLGEWLRIVEGDPSVELGWTEPGPEHAGSVFRSAELDLRALEPGRYTLVLEIGLQGRTPLRAVREIELLP